MSEAVDGAGVVLGAGREQQPRQGVPRPGRQAHVAALDGLRGVAVLGVVAFHTGQVAVGWIGMTLFFVLSGRFITRTLLSHEDAGRAARAANFARNRLLRLAPAYLLFCAVVTVVAFVARSGRGIVGDLPYLWTWTFDLRPLDTGFVPSDLVLYDHVWSLGVEVQLYVVWALLALLLPRRWFVRVVVALVLAGPVLRVLLHLFLAHAGYAQPLQPLALYAFPATYLDAFAIGACTALPEVRRRLARLAPAAVVLFLVAVAGLAAHSLATGHGVPQDLGFPILLTPHGGWVWQYSLIALLAGAATYYAGREGGRFNRLCSARWLVRTGVISYGIYLAHVPVLGLVLSRLHPAAPFSARALLTALLTLVGAVVTAELSFRYLETPFLKLKRGSLAQSIAARRVGARTADIV